MRQLTQSPINLESSVTNFNVSKSGVKSFFSFKQYTVSGKKVEVAVRQTINRERVVNKGSLINPDVLDYFSNLPELADW